MSEQISPPVTLEIQDDASGLGWLAIDSLINHHYCGGLRMISEITGLEMSELAKAMTLKLAHRDKSS